MDMKDFIWYQSPEIWATIISSAAAIISTIIAALFFKKKNSIVNSMNKELETHKAELDRKNREIQTALDIQLEKTRIEYGMVQTKRLDIFYETCDRITTLMNLMNVFSSFHNYECKEYVDFSKECVSSKEALCNKECIINYYDKLLMFEKHCRDTSDFLEKNEMFFSLETINAHLKLIVELFALLQKAYEIACDPKRDKNRQALDCFNLFHEYDTDKLSEIRQTIVDQYRSLIGIPELMKVNRQTT